MSGHPKHPQAKGKSLIIEDDCKGDTDEANPFSFKQFVKSKSGSGLNSTECDGRYTKIYHSQDTRKNVTVIPTSHDGLGVSVEYEETFFKNPTLYENLGEENDDDEEEEEEWSGSYHPLAIERTHNAKTNSSPHSAYDESYDYSASDLSGGEPFKNWDFPGSSSTGYHTKAEPNDSADDLRLHTLQIKYEEVQEENCLLKKQLCDLREINKTQVDQLQHMERKLEERMLEEQKEAQDLESMVQQVEQNLQMMTKRAAKAESNVTRLKQEVTLLQVQLGTYKAENEALRRGETAGMNAVKQNASLALENLHRAVSGAQSSIKQLMSGAESLNLVAELLRSIDKIAEVHEDDVP
ncbi:serologically defined colon cancer antigen 3 isoform X3 [Pelobates cultripes]|uniref:Endosome-associated-trafficking regulator 1 n=1 Tax=Pelobates cultripes TaxID=61616 RepID=A0AAD1T813_PELCU|nr:serologically defined colon cancer antigen 3 isoform X3 [Pelobates cultripes]